MKRLIPFTVSFDALQTLVQVEQGIGHQYRSSYADFLHGHDIDLDASCPNATCDAVRDAALKAIHDQVRQDRAAWTRSADPKEMPIGGTTRAELRHFWARVLRQTFTHPALYEGAAAGVTERVMELWRSAGDHVRRFEDYVVFDQFASTKAHSWLPAAHDALSSLRDWNAQQLARLDDTTAASSSPVHCLAAPPFVVTNMDPRVASVFAQLGALGEEGKEAGAHGGLPPLLSRVITAREVGFAKPSPAGIELGVRDAAAAFQSVCDRLGTSRADVCVAGVDVRRHIHVGDAEADRVACERAGCHYLPCDDVTGVTWALLRAKLRELEAAGA